MCWAYRVRQEMTKNFLSGKPLIKWKLRGQRRWEDNDEIQPKEIRWEVDGTSSWRCPTFQLYKHKIFPRFFTQSTLVSTKIHRPEIF